MGRRRLTRRFKKKPRQKGRATPRSGQRRRALWVAGLLLAALVGARHLAQRSGLRSPAPSTTSTRGGLVGSSVLETGARSALLQRARERLSAATAEPPPAGPSAGTTTVLVSLSRPDATAWISRGQGDSPVEAVLAAVGDMAIGLPTGAAGNGRLKIDLVVESGPKEVFDENGRASIDPSLEGLWLLGPDLLLLPEQLMARRLLDQHGDLQSGRLRRYLQEIGRQAFDVEDNPGAPGMPYRRIRLDSFAEGLDGLPIRLFRGNDRAPDLAPPALLAAARRGGDYLVRQLGTDGVFHYIYDPRKDDFGSGYNLLRHAGSCYSLLELFESTDDHRYLEAARLGIGNLLGHARDPLPADADTDFEAIVSPGEEAKLGGAALTVLAIVEHRLATGDERWLGRAEKLARFMLFQQDAKGRFASKYFYGAPDPEPFESIYYPGEAILALTRLFGVDGNAEWLAAAQRGADYLIDVRDAQLATDELPHDHWLLMALDELDQVTGDPRYADHAARIADAILGAQRTSAKVLDWLGTFYDPPRSTPTATRSEALVAMHRLTVRGGRDGSAYLSALMKMAAFQLRCQLNGTNTFSLPRPDLADGGFRRSLTDYEIRIDYVQHNVSALLGLRQRLTNP